MSPPSTEQLLVRDGDQRIDVLAELADALLRERRRVAFHLEWSTATVRMLSSFATCATTGAAPVPVPAAHAGSDEHVEAFDELDDAVAILHCGLAADLRIARAEALGDVRADLDAGLHRACFSACASVLTQTKSTPSIPEFTMRDGVTAAADTDDLDDRPLIFSFCEYEHCCSPLMQEITLVPVAFPVSACL